MNVSYSSSFSLHCKIWAYTTANITTHYPNKIWTYPFSYILIIGPVIEIYSQPQVPLSFSASSSGLLTKTQSHSPLAWGSWQLISSEVSPAPQSGLELQIKDCGMQRRLLAQAKWPRGQVAVRKGTEERLMIRGVISPSGVTSKAWEWMLSPSVKANQRLSTIFKDMSEIIAIGND